MSMATDPNPMADCGMLTRAQTGRPECGRDLIAEFEPEVRRFVRFRMSSTRFASNRGFHGFSSVRFRKILRLSGWRRKSL